jgi:4-hydroxy-4-methyl-2-oxoglutarate aldolase
MSDVPSVSAIADVLAMRGLGGWLTPPLEPVVAPAQPVMGRAITVELRAEPSGRGLAELHRVLSGELAGGVLVIAGATEVGGAIWGEILSRAASHAGAVAVLVEGSVRDGAAMESEGLPVYAVDERVVGPAGRVSVQTVGEPVRVGGVSVAPGDVIVVDSAGAVRVPAGVADAVLVDARIYTDGEEKVLAELAAGVPLIEAYRHKRAAVDQLHGSGR